MLYPEFEELVSYKYLRLGVTSPSYRRSESMVLGGQHSSFRGRGLEFDSVREYVPGDDIRNIDWRVTARTGTPHLKVFQEEKQRHITLCIDMNARMRFGTRKTFKSVVAAHIASLLGWQAIAQQDRISACLYGDVPGGIESFVSKNSKMSFLQVLKRLSEASSERHQVPFVEALRHVSHTVRTGSLVYFISDFMDLEGEEYEGLFSRLNQRCDVIFISVNDPADKALMPVGRIDVVSTNGQKHVVDTSSLAGRDSYVRQWEENRKGLYEKVTQFGIPLVELTTQSDIKKDLWPALKSLSRRKRR